MNIKSNQFVQCTGQCIGFMYSIFSRFAEFYRTWFKPGKHDGCVRAIAPGHRTVHRTLLDSIEEWHSQSGKLEIRI